VRPAKPVALMAALEVVVGEEASRSRWISSGSEYQVCQPATRKHSSSSVRFYALGEAVGARRADLGRAKLDAVHGEEQFVGMRL